MLESGSVQALQCMQTPGDLVKMHILLLKIPVRRKVLLSEQLPRDVRASGL